MSLLHGDSHLGNFFVSGDEMGMLDWQAAHWGKGIRDVEYFLVDALPADVLAEHERELVDYYVQRRAHHGPARRGDPGRAGALAGGDRLAARGWGVRPIAG